MCRPNFENEIKNSLSLRSEKTPDPLSPEKQPALLLGRRVKLSGASAVFKESQRIEKKLLEFLDSMVDKQERLHHENGLNHIRHRIRLNEKEGQKVTSISNLFPTLIQAGASMASSYTNNDNLKTFIQESLSNIPKIHQSSSNQQAELEVNNQQALFRKSSELVSSTDQRSTQLMQSLQQLRAANAQAKTSLASRG